MEVHAFAAARRAVLEEAGGVTAEGFPMTSCWVDSFPAQITVPLVLAVHAAGGSDYNMRRFIVAKSPAEERVGLLEFAWEWPDNPGSPVKFRVFAHYLPMSLYSGGLYSIGLYENPNGEPEFEFPLPVQRLNPLTGPPPVN
jgi:hypothetical protein